eukprot:CAMPEP_0202903016 /NCGR_PEP_ID=MMETSP1392-20130828/20356_1 /ASSEMBLY_ACC=CAM_ASM_000868 /TAXON_ID=225041 /ORGANISM="Chlamydomonas chlamydogama, Strain SAG 11-48b" /LENGTH=132 /DNA_ID=CAMNT_0049589967 /DNA_START=53 /DNA_END=451 /DNA_ORIENTATION=-
MTLPFRLVFTGATQLDMSSSRMQFRLLLIDPAASFTLNKIEFGLRPEAQGKIAQLYYGTIRKGPSYQTYPGQGLVFKITQIDQDVPPGAGGVPISFVVPRSLAALDALFTSSVYAAFTPNQKGCPLGTIATA